MPRKSLIPVSSSVVALMTKTNGREEVVYGGAGLAQCAFKKLEMIVRSPSPRARISSPSFSFSSFSIFPWNPSRPSLVSSMLVIPLVFQNVGCDAVMLLVLGVGIFCFPPFLRAPQYRTVRGGTRLRLMGPG
jgi:hypothetical protein